MSPVELDRWPPFAISGSEAPLAPGVLDTYDRRPIIAGVMKDAKRCPNPMNSFGLGMLWVYQTIVGRTPRG